MFSVNWQRRQLLNENQLTAHVCHCSVSPGRSPSNLSWVFLCNANRAALPANSLRAAGGDDDDDEASQPSSQQHSDASSGRAKGCGGQLLWPVFRLAACASSASCKLQVCVCEQHNWLRCHCGAKLLGRMAMTLGEKSVTRHRQAAFELPLTHWQRFEVTSIDVLQNRCRSIATSMQMERPFC